MQEQISCYADDALLFSTIHSQTTLSVSGNLINKLFLRVLVLVLEFAYLDFNVSPRFTNSN